MNTKAKIGIGSLVIILIALGVFLYARRASAANGLNRLNAVDAMAYRYTAMAKYYDEKLAAGKQSSSVSSIGAGIQSVQSASGYPLGGTQLNALSPADAMAFRYQVWANYYATHPSATR